MLVLIDAYSQIFRAFYAVRMLTNSSGEPTNAVYVFTRILLKLTGEYPDASGALLFDCGKVQFRLELAPAYKGNRPPMPEELKRQVPRIKAMADAFGWPSLHCENFEADDLIAGFALATDEQVRIVTGDKDIAQLVDDRIHLLVPGAKGGFEERDRDGVREKYRVEPRHMVDYLALLGDASDNLPGVPGVGPKTAAAIIERFGAAERWLEHPELIDDPKLLAKLQPHFETVKLNRKLITLRSTLPEQFTPPREHCRRRPPDWEKIRALCEELELHSLLRELPAEGAASAAPAPLPKSSEEADDNDLFSVAASAPPAAKEEVPDDGKTQTLIQGELF